MVFHGVELGSLKKGTLKAGELIPDTTFLYGGHRVIYGYQGFIGVEPARDIEMEISFPVSAQTISTGELFCTDEPIVIGSGESMLVSAGEKVCTSSFIAIGNYASYFSEIKVIGPGALLEGSGIYMEGWGSRLQIQNGEVVRSTASFGL